MTRLAALLGLILALAAAAQEPPFAPTVAQQTAQVPDDARTLVVIVHPDSGVDRLERRDAINLFMGRYRRLPSGLLAFPIDIGDHTPERRLFYERLVGRSLADIDAYWSRLVFSGQTSPPLQVPNAATAADLVAGNRAAIAYVWRNAADARVRVVLELPQ